MKKRILLLCAVLLLSAGCAAERTHTAAFFAMDTFMELRVTGDVSLTAGAEELIRAMEGRLSVTAEGSEIRALNESGASRVSADTAALIDQALSLCDRTDGALDISVYPVLRAWGFTTDAYRVPDDAEIRALLPLVDYRNIKADGDEVRLAPGMQIDLGSVAKGWAGDRTADYLRENGVRSALINLGGSIRAVGMRPDGTPWRIAVRDPFGGDTLGVLRAADCAVVTSGGYERCFEEDGVTYWHILDPATGYPARSGLASVTVTGSDGTVCDALSTALFVLGAERGAALWRESGDFEALFVTDEGELLLTEGLAESFEPTGAYADREVKVIRRD